MFRLLRYFSLTALVSLSLAAVALAWLFQRSAEQDLLNSSQRANETHAQVFANALQAELGDALWKYLTVEAPRLNAEQLRAHPMTQQMHALLRQLAHDTNVAKVKLYSPGGLTLYSSEAKQIGEDKHNVELIQRAARGETASVPSQRERFQSFEGEIRNRHLVSTYIPARVPGRAGITGVFELYADLTPLYAALEQTKQSQAITLISVMAALFALQWLIVRHGARIIARQHAGLEAARREIESARQEAEAANAAKSRFLADMSHEIRTPMHGMLGMTELLQSTPLDAVQARYAQTVARSGQSLLTILNDILDLSKIEAGKLELDPHPFVLREPLQEVVDLMLARAAAKGLALSIDLPPGLPERVRGDSLRLRQVLANLVGNAIKFTRSGKVVVTLRRGAAPDEYRFTVSDTGIGIAADVAERLFQPYAQADAAVARRSGGSGLGLAIARRLVELMGGRIGVRSTPGEGAEFWFSVPLPESDEAGTAPGALAPASEPAAGDAALPLLLVEDNPVNVLYAEAVLQALHRRVVVAHDGEQALALLRGQAFGLILLDCHMPGLDGPSATPRIRALEAGLGRPRTPIVAVSAGVMADERERCIAAGMDDFLAKPFSVEQLRAVLARWAPVAA